jgi:cytochrome P450
MATLAHPVDLYRELALPVTSSVIWELLGVPEGKQSWFQECSQFMMRTDVTPEEQEHVRTEMLDYMRDLVASKHRDGSEDLLSRFAQDSVGAAESFTDEELTGLGVGLLVAGHETTAATISLAVLALLRHPRQLAALRTDPEKTARAVEELLRYLPVLPLGLARYDPYLLDGPRVADNKMSSMLPAGRSGSVAWIATMTSTAPL